MQSTEELKSIVKERLSKKRYQHSVYVAEAAKKLAKIYGSDCDKAYTAGILHDLCKEISPVEQRKLVERCNMNVTAEELEIQPLWHAIAGAQFCMETLGITDTDMLNAIRYHTVARENMSLLEEIVYLADLTSEDRDYDDIEKMRKLSTEGITQAMRYALSFQICDVVKKKSLLPNHTAQAYNYYVGKTE